MAYQILVIDDDKDVRQILKEMLIIKGYSVTDASDGEEALKLIEKDRFDLILTDLIMPKVSGWDIVRQAKKKDQNIPVIVISGWVDRLSDGDPIEKQADLILAKPVIWNDLLTAVSKFLGPLEDNLHTSPQEPRPGSHLIA